MKVDFSEWLDINDFGEYRLGLTSSEINEYLRLRTGKKKIKGLREKFRVISGVNTMATSAQGHTLMFRHDVERFTDKLLLNKPTYFD